MMASNPRNKNKRETRLLSRRKAFSFDSLFKVSVKMGMNAELKVPSPSILRNKFGKVKASINASPMIEAPKQPKNMISLAKPEKRDTSVSELTSVNRPKICPINQAENSDQELFLQIAFRKKLSCLFSRVIMILFLCQIECLFQIFFGFFSFSKFHVCFPQKQGCHHPIRVVFNANF